jgi:hypothetical protein
LKLFYGAEFAKVDTVKDESLGPTMNFISCRGCHSYLQSAGIPLENWQWKFTTEFLKQTNAPSFILEKGPKGALQTQGRRHAPRRRARLVRDDGLDGAKGCHLKQPNFKPVLKKHNVIFRIPTPTFGAGLVEQIEDAAIIANQEAQKNKSYGGGKGYRLKPGHLNFGRIGHTLGGDQRADTVTVTSAPGRMQLRVLANGPQSVTRDGTALAFPYDTATNTIDVAFAHPGEWVTIRYQ